MKVIRIYETVFQSIVTDSYTFGILFALWFLNHKYCNGSWLIDLCVTILVILFALGRSKRFTVKSAVEYLQSEEARQYIIEGVKTHHATQQGTQAAEEKDAASGHC
jgi:hypothetical protein